MEQKLKRRRSLTMFRLFIAAALGLIGVISLIIGLGLLLAVEKGENFYFTAGVGSGSLTIGFIAHFILERFFSDLVKDQKKIDLTRRSRCLEKFFL